MTLNISRADHSGHPAGSTTNPIPANQLALVALRAGDLQALSLTVAAGECVVIAGPSGSGKSRLLRAIADLDPPPAGDAGQVMLGGIDRLDYSGAMWRRRVAYLAAESQWWFDDVASHFPAALAMEQLQALGLPAKLLAMPVSRLSVGERQRLALLRLLMQQPQVLLLDEPTASLDPASTAAVEQLVNSYRQQHQAAVIWVSHDVAQGQRVGQRYFYIHQDCVTEQSDEGQR